MSDDLQVFHDGFEWVIARSPADASVVWCRYVGEDPKDWKRRENDWRPMDQNASLLIFTNDDDVPTSRTCAEWIAIEGRGYLCTSDGYTVRLDRGT